MVTCLLCHRPIPDPELDYCARRHTDGEPVCPACTAKVRAGDRDALNALFDAREVHGH